MATGVWATAPMRGLGFLAACCILFAAGQGHAGIERTQEQVAQQGDLWRLRAGLNVAALQCRHSGGGITKSYGKMLTRHRALLAAIYRDEQRRYGDRAFDRRQTDLYNHFAFQPSPERFCRVAGSVASRAVAMNSRKLVPSAPVLLAELEGATGYY